jgi:hypothetical protein
MIIEMLDASKIDHGETLAVMNMITISQIIENGIAIFQVLHYNALNWLDMPARS